MDKDYAKKKLANVALKEMFKPSGHFSICTIRECMEMLNIPPNKETMEMLNPMHCIRWGDMDEETRDIILLCVMELFNEKPFNVANVIDFSSKRSGFLAVLN